MPVNRAPNVQISSAGLHILAMGFMLCDHLWAMLFPAQGWLTCVGRLAFPIFAFMIAEGYRHTHSLRRYLLRMLFWAAAAEIPFNLMYSNSVYYPFHQNVLWTFLLSLILIALIDKCRTRFPPVGAGLATAGLALLGYVLGYLTMVDYYGVGVLMVLTFFLFPGRDWKSRLGQLFCLYVLNVHLLGGFFYEVVVFGFKLEIVQQSLALLALIPIWLYQGRQGFRSRAFQAACYAFYPAHMLVLFAVREWMIR